jgi:hypothetical protein
LFCGTLRTTIGVAIEACTRGHFNPQRAVVRQTVERPDQALAAASPIKKTSIHEPSGGRIPLAK